MSHGQLSTSPEYAVHDHGNVLLAPFLVDDEFLGQKFPGVTSWLETLRQAEAGGEDLPDDPGAINEAMIFQTVGRIIVNFPGTKVDGAVALLTRYGLDTAQDPAKLHELSQCALNFSALFTDFFNRSYTTLPQVKDYIGTDPQLHYQLVKQAAAYKNDQLTAGHETLTSAFMTMNALNEVREQGNGLVGSLLKELEGGIFDQLIIQDVIEYIMTHGPGGNRQYTEIERYFDTPLLDGEGLPTDNITHRAAWLQQDHARLFMKARQRLIDTARESLWTSIANIQEGGFAPSPRGDEADLARYVAQYNIKQRVRAQVARVVVPAQITASAKRGRQPVIPRQKEPVPAIAKAEAARPQKHLVAIDEQGGIHDPDSSRFQRMVRKFLGPKRSGADEQQLKDILNELLNQESSGDLNGAKKLVDSSIRRNDRVYDVWRFKPQEVSSLSGNTLTRGNIRVLYVRLDGDKIAIHSILDKKDLPRVARSLGIAVPHAT